tara:strand:- start:4648 stop:4923 length:276 start_codon:yes stop_codon:yes gene_type:complete
MGGKPTPEKPNTLDVILAYTPVPGVGDRKCLQYTLNYHRALAQRNHELVPNIPLIDELSIRNTAVMDAVAIRSTSYISVAYTIYEAFKHIF